MTSFHAPGARAAEVRTVLGDAEVTVLVAGAVDPGVPSGSVIVSLCSWLIVESDGSAVLPFGRGLPDWQCPDTALYGITA